MVRSKVRVPTLCATLALLAPAAGWCAVENQAPATESSEYYEDAQMRFNRGEYPAAAIQLKNALRSNPQNLPARILLGLVYLRQGYGAAAEAELWLALERGADEQLVAVPLANAYLLQAKYADVVKFVGGLGANAKLSHKTLLAKGEAHLRLQQWEEADRAFTEAAALAPEEAEPLLGQARVRMRRGRLGEARELLALAMERSPYSAEPPYLLGELDRMERNLDAALRSYDRAIELSPGHLRTRNSRAATLLELGDCDRSLVDVEAVLSQSPEDPQALYMRFLCLAQTPDKETAVRSLELAARNMRRLDAQFVASDPPSLLLSAAINVALGRFEQAILDLGGLLDLVPVHPGARKLLGSLLVHQEEFSSAADVLLPALRQGGANDPELLAALGNAYLGDDRPELAEDMFQRAERLTPTSTGIRTQLALSHLAAGDADKAILGLEAILAGPTPSVRSGVLLALVRLQRGEHERALEVAQRLAERAPTDPVVRNLEGRIHLERGELETARLRLEHALILEPRFNPPRHLLAEMALEAGDYEAAAEHYRAILATAAEDTRAMYGLSRVAEQQGRLNEAIRWREKARAVDPGAVGEHIHLVELHLRAGAKTQALQVARALEERDFDNLAVLAALGRTYVAMQDMDKARTTFSRMSRFAGNNAQALHRVAEYQVGVGDLEGARWTLEQAITAEPKYRAGYAALVRLELRMGLEEKALARVRALREAQPGLALADELLGDVHLSANRFGAAVQAYEAALALRASPEVIVRLYRALRAAGAAGDGVERLEAWLRVHGADERVQRALATAYMDEGRDKEAIRLHERLLDLRPDDAALLNNLAWLTHRSGGGDALHYARRAFELAPELPTVLDTLGWILVQEGDPSRGLSYLREAQSRASQDAQIRYHLSVALSRLGRNAEARRELRRALRDDDSFEGADAARAMLEAMERGD